MPAVKNKVNSDYECSVERLQEIKNDINIVSTHSKWVLSLLAAIALGLASFVFTDIGELHIIYKELNKPDLLIKVFAGSLFILYSLFIIVFVPLTLLVRKTPPDNEAKGLQARIKESHKRLGEIDRLFRRLIRLFVASPFLAAIFATYFTYFV